jgi:hypothetical protein
VDGKDAGSAYFMGMGVKKDEANDAILQKRVRLER